MAAGTLTAFAARLAGGDLAARAIEAAGPAVAVAAASGVRRGMTDGVSPNGTPYAPLGRPRPNGGSKPLLDTGLLRASVSAMVTGDELILRASGAGARLHQFGGIVVPKAAKFLAIPLTPEAKRVGSPRRFPRPLAFLRSQSGSQGGILGEKTGTGKGAKVKAHYALVRSVTVPARPYLGVSAATAGAIGGIVSKKYAALAAGGRP